MKKLAEKRKLSIETMEGIILRQRKEIKNLKEEIDGCRQVMQILEAFIIEGVEKKGEVQIPIAALSEGLKTGYKIDIKEDMYVISKRA